MALPPQAAIAEAYGLAIRDWRQVGRVWQIETDGGLYLCKQALPLAQDLFLAGAESHLLNHGFYRFPRRRWTKQAEPGCTLPDGKRYALWHWQQGTTLASPEANPHHLRLAGASLAEFHLAGSGWLGIGETRRAWGALISVFAARLEDLRAFREDGAAGPFPERYRAEIAEVLTEAEIALESLSHSGYAELSREAQTRGGLCHGDLAPNNLLLAQDGLHLLDLERAGLEIPPFDLALLIRRLACHCRWDPGLSDPLLNAYEGKRPLTPAERRALAAIILWPQEFWRLGHQYFRERLARPETHFLDRLTQWTTGASGRRRFLAEWRGKLGGIGR